MRWFVSGEDNKHIMICLGSVLSAWYIMIRLQFECLVYFDWSVI